MLLLSLKGDDGDLIPADVRVLTFPFLLVTDVTGFHEASTDVVTRIAAHRKVVAFEPCHHQWTDEDVGFETAVGVLDAVSWLFGQWSHLLSG